jgi:hypothetical protein
MIDLIALFALGYILVIGLVALAFWIGSELMRRTRSEQGADDAREDGDLDGGTDDAKIAV